MPNTAISAGVVARGAVEDIGEKLAVFSLRDEAGKPVAATVSAKDYRELLQNDVS